MDKNEVLNWLNRRKDLSAEGKSLLFDDADLTFVRNYVHHFSGKLVSFENIVASFQSHDPMYVMEKIDFMINKLVTTFKIKVKTEPKTMKNPQLNIFLGEHPFATIKVDFVVEYH